MESKYYLFSIGFILLLISSIFLFTQPAFFESYDLSETGQIGDTIGGITAPFINLLGAVLVFLSFTTQNNANKILSEQNSFSLLHELYKDLKNDFTNLSFSSPSIKEGKEYQGKRALSLFANTLSKRIDNINFPNNSFFDELLFLMGNFTILIDIIETSNITEEQKKYVLRLIHFLYLTRISKHLITIIKITENKQIHMNFHSTLKDVEKKIEENYQKHFG